MLHGIVDSQKQDIFDSPLYGLLEAVIEFLSTLLGTSTCNNIGRTFISES